MTFTAEQLNSARKEGYSDDEIWEYLGGQDKGFAGAKQEGYSLDEVAGYFSSLPAPTATDKLQSTAEELEAGIGRAGLAFSQAAVGSVRMLTDVFGANNPVSKKIAGVEDYLDKFVTAQAKQDKEEISRLFQEAEEKGLGAKVMAGLEAVAVSPETLGAEVAGYMLPSLAAGVLTAGASLPVTIGAQAAVGGLQAAGTIKGEIYTSVRDFAREQGLDEEQADKVASEAQAYGGKNLDQILIGAGIGALAASTGVERIATRILSGQGKAVTKKSIGEFVKTGLKAGGVEGVIEGVQEGQEQMATNIALQREGADVPTMRMVPQAATMGAAAGVLMGGAVGGIEFVSAEQKELNDIEKTAERESRSLSAPDAATQSAVNILNQTENSIDSLREELDILEPTDPRAQNLRLRISEEQKKAEALKVVIGEKKETALSEPIAAAEAEQARLAREIAAPVEEVVTPPTEVDAPTIEAAPVEPTPVAEAPAPTVQEGLTVPPTEEAVTPPVEPTAAVEKAPIEPVAEAPAITPAPAAEAAPAPVERKSKKRKGILGEQYINKDWTSLTKDELPQLNRELYNYYDWAKTVVDKLIPNANDFEKKALIMELRNEITEETAKPEFKDREQYILAQKVAGELITGKRRKILQRAKERAMGDEYAAWEMGGRFEESPISVEAFDSNAKGRPLPEGYIKQGDLYVYRPTEAPTPAAPTPTAPAVGNRIKLGKSPQTYTIEEVIPQSETEKELGKQSVSVRNEKTGEVQTVEAKDLKPVKAKGVRKMAARVKDESLVVPEADRYTFEQAEAEATKLFSGMPEGFIIVNDSVDPEYEFKAGYEPETGDIILNLAYIRKGESVRNLIAHELGHYAAGDPEIRAKLQEFLDALPPATRSRIERFVERFYNEDTGEMRLEEKQVRAFVQMLKKSENRNVFQKLLDAIKKWLNDNLGTNFQPTDMDAAAVLSGAINRFKAGEFIAREEETGILAARPERREQQAGRKGVGKVITTPEGINVRTENIVRSNVFNADTVSKENTDKAYDIIDRLSGADKEASNKYAEEINDLVRGKLSEEEGRKVEQSIGAVKLGNELFKYAANLAGKGDLRMLQLLTDRFNDLSTGYGSVGAAARDLQARTNLANWVTRASEAQKKGIINAVAIKIYGPNATQEQIKTIEDAINKVNKTKVEDADEIYTDLETTGEKQGVDIRKAVDRAMDRIPPQNRDPWVVALEVLKDVEGFESFQYVKVKGMDEKKLKQEILAAVTRSIKKNLADFQKKMSKKGAEGMEITFWKTMSDEERKIGPLGEVDMAVNRNLSAIVKDTLIKMGLKGAPPDTKMTLIEQVANIITNNKLTDAKITEADERISAEIASRETAEIKAAEESGADPDVIEMIEAKYSAIREAWDMSMSRQLDIPISDSTLRRLIFNRLKDSNVKMSELVQQIKDDPAVGEARKASIVRQIIKELNGINEDGTIQAEYQKLADALNTQLSQMVENNKLKGRMKSAVKAVARDANKPDAQAEKQINKLATLQSDVNEWPQSKEDKVRDIVRNDLKQKLDLGLKVAPKIKAAWIPTLTNNLKKVGVSDATAQTLAELVWRQHEINYMNRKMAQIERAVTGGSLAPIIDAIKSTPLSQQQEAGWKRKVAYDYLINAGLDKQNAARVADLMDITLQKVLAEAQAKAFYDTVKGTLAEERSRRGMKRFLEAIRTGALDPSKNITSELAEQNGWTGFTPEQYARLAELDTLVNNEDILDLERATAFKEIQDIIAAAKVPPRVRDTLSSYYVAQALSGIPTATVNIFSPIGYALRYAFTAGVRTAIKNPSQLPMVFSSMLSAFKSYTSEVAYSWKNNVQRRGVVEYLANDDKLLELFNKGKKQWEQGKRAEGFKNMLFGSMEYVSRMLKALDEGAISVLEQQGLTRYAMAAMDKAGIKSSEQIAVANMVMKSKQEFILNSIAKGMNKRDAIAFSDDVYRSAWQEALSNLKIDSQEVLDSAINDALAAVGRINTSVNALTGEETKRVSDRGFASSIPIGFLESISKAANSQDANELQRIFYRMTYGFAIVPARVFREAAWFTPYGFVRFAVDSAARGMGYSSPYAQSLGTDIQRQQRLTETIAGSIVMLGALAMASSSIDDPEDELPFKVVFTGNGPDRRKDPQFFDTWRKKFKPNSINIFFGKTKFSINIERGFEAFAVPFMLAGAVDDWRIRKQFEQTKKTPQDLSDAAIILGSAFMSFNKRGPYSAFIDTYSTASNSDNILASATKQAAFYAKTFIPVVGTSLARNISDFINDPIDKSTLDGALYSNIPVLGPMMGTKSMNAVGQTQGATEFSDRLYRAGIPLVFSLPKNNESEKINQLILKQGQGPSIPTRYNVRQRLGYEPNNKQYEKFVTEYGKYMAKTMTENHKLLMEKSPASYMKWVEKKSETARSIATRAAKEIPNPNSP